MPKEKTKEKNKKRLVLLDSHAIMHRAYHALPDFTSSSGEPTGALYGLSAMLMKIVGELKPDYVVACYDMADPTYRHDAFEGYKAGRAKTDESLVEQIKRSYDVYKAFSIPIYEVSGFEADDVLGTIVEELKGEKDVEIIIASGDMDTLQLVDNKKVRVYTLRRGMADTILYDEEAVKERFGFGPELLPDYKGLRGDPSDNIPGVRGVGEKTATSLITQIGDIKKIYKELKRNPEKVKEKAGVTDRIIKLLLDNEEEAEFSRMLGEIRRDAPINFTLPDKEWRDTVEAKNILELFSNLSFKTLSLRAKNMLSYEGKVAEEEEALAEREKVSEAEIRKVGIALWLLDSTLSNPTEDDILSFAKIESFKEAKGKIFKKLEEQDLLKVYEDIELPLLPMVEKMESRGITIDENFLKTLSKKYHKEIEKIERKIWEIAGEEFNINSPKQLGEVLYDKLSLGSSGIKKTSTGARSTRESELQKMVGEHEIIELVLEYRELGKLLSTYIDNLPAQVGEDGKLHASFIQTGTTTGRMSSQNPNLQNIPIKTDRGREIRKAFTASKGFVLADLDYSQIELRVAAMLSGDEKLTRIFTESRDVHTEVAAEVFGIPPDKVGKKERSQAKVINFGILYGMGVNALSKNLGAPRKDAQKYLSEYFKSFSGLKEYMDKLKAGASVKGYVETYFGRKRFLEGIKSRLPYVRAEAERQAMNAPMQGTQADIIKIAMTRVDEWIKKEKLEKDVYLLLQVHDELVYEIRCGKEKKIIPEIKKIMEGVLSEKETGGIKFETSVEVGENWGETEPLE
jgi:DNA polymerase-1